MKAKRSLMAAIVGIATMIAMPLVALAGDRYTEMYENIPQQAYGAIIPVGHHGWRNSTSYNPNLICDEDGDDCHPAMDYDADRDDCAPPAGYGYEGQYTPSYRGRAYDNQNYDYNPGYGRGYGAPAYNNYGSTRDTAARTTPLTTTTGHTRERTEDCQRWRRYSSSSSARNSILRHS